VGVLQDPTIGLNVVISDGTTPSILRAGPGHRLGTPLPGARGNSVVYGHRRDWGAPFKNLSQLTVGSTLYLQAQSSVFAPGPHASATLQTGYYIYTVTNVATVSSSDTRPLAQTNDFRLTLITNSGGRLSGSRLLVVTAVSNQIGKITGAAPSGILEPSTGSDVFNLPVLSLLVWAVVARWIIAFLRRSHGTLVAVLVAGPVVIAAVISAFLVFDIAAFRPLA